TIQRVCLCLGGIIGLVSLYRAGRDSGPGEVDRSFSLLIVTSILLCPLGWVYYFWLPLVPVLAVVQRWKRSDAPSGRSARWGQVVFWIASAGLLWPVQLNALGQESAWATVVIGNLYFWTILGIWLGLLLRGRATSGPLAAPVVI